MIEIAVLARKYNVTIEDPEYLKRLVDAFEALTPVVSSIKDTYFSNLSQRQLRDPGGEIHSN